MISQELFLGESYFPFLVLSRPSLNSEESPRGRELRRALRQPQATNQSSNSMRAAKRPMRTLVTNAPFAIMELLAVPLEGNRFENGKDTGNSTRTDVPNGLDL
jgi:hypothetical protein